MIQQAIEMPWQARDFARLQLTQPWVRLLFRFYGISWGRGWKVWGMPIILKRRGSTMRFGDELDMRSWATSNPLSPNHRVVLATRSPHATIQAGVNCGFTGTTLVAAEAIIMGDRVVVGANCTIADTDFHPLTRAERAEDILAGAAAPITIQDDVFIGLNSLILKGVTIGHDSVIGAGSVVTKDIPPGVVAAGNPARVVRELESV